MLDLAFGLGHNLQKTKGQTVKFIIYLFALFFILHVNTFASDLSELQLLEKMVEIPSGSENIAGVNAVQAVVQSELENLGFEVNLKTNPAGETKSGKLLVGTLQGESPLYITFIGHADTVFAKESTKTVQYNPDHTQVTGSGVIDNKGGLVIAISALRQLLHNGQKPHYSIRFVSSPNEEVGSTGFVPDFRKFAEDTVLALTVEPAMDDGSIIDARRGNRWYSIHVDGKEAHSGRAVRDGVNACYELAMKLDRIEKLTDFKKNYSTSIGHMSGGKDRFNIVCGSADAKIDTRFGNLKTRDEKSAALEKILNTTFIPGSITKFEIADDTPPFSRSKRSDAVTKTYLNILAQVEGKAILAHDSGETTDGNFFMLASGKSVILDGLGPVGGGMHTKDEWALVSSYATRSKAMATFLTQFKAPN